MSIMVEKLCYLKKRHKITAEQLSLLCGVPLGTLNKILTGQTRNPALHTMYEISKALGVPLRYLLDDDIPIHCDTGCYADSGGLIMITSQEAESFLKFRQLKERDKRTMHQLLLTLWNHHCTPTCTEEPECVLPCYLPMSRGCLGACKDNLNVRTLSTPLSPIAQSAAFAFKLADDSLDPVYRADCVLAARTGEAEHNQLGVFQIGGEIVVRKFYRKHETTKLVSVKVGVADIPITGAEQFSCCGVILGVLRNYRWL